MTLADFTPQGLAAKALACLALVAVGAGIGWEVNGWRKDADIATLKASHEAAVSKALGAAVAQRDAAILARDTLAVKLAGVDADHNETLRRFKHENDTLRAGAATGTVGVRVVGAHCPAAHDVPGTPAGSGVDTAAGAELDADARQRYFALREALGAGSEQLAACQTSLGLLTGQRQPAAVAPGAASNAP